MLVWMQKQLENIKENILMINIKDIYPEVVFNETTKPKLEFVHVRNGNLYNDTPDAKGGVTIAYLDYNEYIIYAVASCSIRDNYNKKLGRLIASNRLLSGLGISTKKINNSIIQSVSQDLRESQLLTPYERKALEYL